MGVSYQIPIDTFNKVMVWSDREESFLMQVHLFYNLFRLRLKLSINKIINIHNIE